MHQPEQPDICCVLAQQPRSSLIELRADGGGEDNLIYRHDEAPRSLTVLPAPTDTATCQLRGSKACPLAQTVIVV